MIDAPYQMRDINTINNEHAKLKKGGNCLCKQKKYQLVSSHFEHRRR